MPAHASRRRYLFDRFELHAADGRLLESGKPVSLSNRARDLLLALIESGDRLVPKAALLQKVWPGLVVEENTLQVHVSALRKLLGRDAIVTVSGRGYRFSMAVTSVDDEPVEQGIAGNLPRPTTSFIGRRQESKDIKGLLDRSRLLTIVGVGGCGKTRLAIEVATERRHAMPDGVWFIELAAVSNESLIPERIASAVGLPERPGASILDDLFGHFADKRALLIFDNVEHLVAPCARLIDALLSRCPNLVFLVTSRERLGVLGETLYPVPLLAVPALEAEADPASLADCESVALFVDRARLLRPHFSVTLSNATLVASICRRLDGMPLAIELAAPRLRSMPLEEILERLDRRFSLLGDTTNARVPRQRTLRFLIDWSYELLTPAEQAVLCRVAVFSGGWTLGAAEKVCSGDEAQQVDMLEVLASLVDKNLLSTEEKFGVERYRILETIRQYALERLTENPARYRRVKARHLAYFVAFGLQAEPAMQGPNQLTWFDRLEADHDNIRAAMGWSLGEGLEPVGGATLAGSIWRFWMARGHAREGSDFLRKTLAALPEDSPPELRGKVLYSAGALAYLRSDVAAANDLWGTCLEIGRACGNKAGVFGALNGLAGLSHAVGEPQKATGLLEESLSIAEELGDEARIGMALHNLGDNAREMKRDDDAIRYFERCLVIHRRLENPHVIASDLISIGVVVGHGGDHAGARKWLLQGLQIFGSLGDRWQVVCAVNELAWMTAARGLILRAARLWAANAAIRKSTGAPLTELQQAQHVSEVSSARARLGDDSAFDQAWREGAAMRLEDMVRYATEPGEHWPDDWHDAPDTPMAGHQEISGIHQN